MFVFPLSSSLLLLAGAASVLPPRDAGLVAHWRLAATELEDGLFRDRGGSRPLPVAGDPHFLGEGEGGALLFPAGGEPLVAEEGASGESLPARKLTLEVWVLLDAAGPWSGFVSAIEDNGDYERGWMLGSRNRTFAFALATEDTGRLTYLTSPTPFELGTWYHVVGTYDGRTQRLFVDGKLAAESRAPGGDVLYHDAHHFVVGAYVDANERHPFVGAMYEVRVLERCLSPMEVVGRYRALRKLLPALEGETANPVRKVTVAEMQPAIDEAIDRGVDHLLRRQHRDGSWEQQINVYRNGQTALSTYTLLKSGLPANHPSIGAALAFLRRRPPAKTYSVACQLLALSALGDPAHREWARELVDTLVEFEHPKVRGAWSYPGGIPDLSCTQFAALGLWAGHLLGIDPPRELWQRMVLVIGDGFQGRRTKVEWVPPGAKRAKERRVAGYSYRTGDGKQVATGSMTTAGLCVGALAEICTGGELGTRFERIVRPQRRLALDWLDTHWTVSANPNRGGTPYYYLYGIERVGALLGLERIGRHPWYRDGAEYLVKQQGEDGGWGTQSDTCFALLFLSRATAPTSGANAVERRGDVWEVTGGDVRLRAVGGLELTVWLTGFDPALRERFDAQPPRKRGLRVVRVEYLVDGETRATAEGDPYTPWTGEQHPARLRIDTPGKHSLVARVHVVPLGDYPDTFQTTTVLETEPLDFEVRMTPEAFLAANAGVGERNEVLAGRPRVRASSRLDDAHAPGRAVDGYDATSWITAADDLEPRITLEFERPVRADRLVLTPIDGKVETLAEHDVPLRVAVRVDRVEDPFEVTLDPRGVFPGTLDFGKPLLLRRLELRILDRVPGTIHPGGTGFAEVELRRLAR